MNLLHLMHLHPALTGLIAGPVLGIPLSQVIVRRKWRRKERRRAAEQKNILIAGVKGAGKTVLLSRRSAAEQRDRLLGIPQEYRAGRNGGSR